MTLTFDLKIKIQLCSCIIFSCTLVVKSDSDWSRRGKIWHGQGFITMVCYELEFLFRYWFKVTTHPLLTSPLMWRHGSDGTGEKNIVWTRLFIDVCYDLDLWPRNLILRSHYTLNPKVHFGCYKYQYAYESNLVKGKDYMVLTKILHINSLTFTFDQESRSKATVHHSPKGTHRMKYDRARQRGRINAVDKWYGADERTNRLITIARAFGEPGLVTVYFV